MCRQLARTPYDCTATICSPKHEISTDLDFEAVMHSSVLFPSVSLQAMFSLVRGCQLEKVRFRRERWQVKYRVYPETQHYRAQQDKTRDWHAPPSAPRYVRRGTPGTAVFPQQQCEFRRALSPAWPSRPVLCPSDFEAQPDEERAAASYLA